MLRTFKLYESAQESVERRGSQFRCSSLEFPAQTEFGERTCSVDQPTTGLIYSELVAGRSAVARCRLLIPFNAQLRMFETGLEKGQRMADYFYAVDLSRNEELARTPAMLTNFSSSWFAKTTAMKIATSLTARMQHAKSRSMLRKNDTVCWEQKMSVTKSKSIWCQHSSECRRTPI
jgi:hypothetical protein